MPPKKLPAKTAQAKPVAKAGTSKKPVTTTAKTAKKPAAPGPSKSKPTAEKAVPAAKKWTADDEAARKIQSEIRRYLAKKELNKRKKARQDYLKQMDDLEKQAFAKLVKMEQEQAEKERQKEEEERKRRREAEKRKKRMLEASFDGDNDEINTVFKEVRDLDEKNGVGDDTIGLAIKNKHLMDMVECEDANNNTPLSEAAGGGHVDTIKLLLDLGADPNSRGRFLRTPLYRAAFSSHLEACQVLLSYGADPRIYAEDGQTPGQIASGASIRELFESWDIGQTEKLLQKIETDKERRKDDERKRHAAEMSRIEAKVEEAEKEHKLQQLMVLKTTQELNKRIEEHDQAVASGFERPEITLQAIHDAESDLDLARLAMDKARDHLSSLRLQVREHLKDKAEAEGHELPGLKVTIRELDDVLLRDVGNRIKDSGKWPLVIDGSGQAAIFLRYRDTNFINALSPADMAPEKIRLAILGALRYGKPVVLDMMEVDMFDTCTMKFDDVQKGLMDAIMDKSILEEKVYIKLIQDSDGPDYSKNSFNDLRLQNFSFVILSKNIFPPNDLVESTYTIRVHIPT